jgi:hypothetical protein
MRTWTRLSTLLALGAGFAAAACGGNNNNSAADARVADAPNAADAPPPDARVKVRSGTLAVTELSLTDPAVAQLGLGGSSISFEIDDLTKNDGGMLAAGDPTQLNGCYVYTYDVGAAAVHKPHPPVDEGIISITGAGLKEPGPYHCAFAGSSYRCDGGDQPAAQNIAGLFNTTTGNTTLTVTNVTFKSTDIGKYLVLSGFPDPYNMAFPIVGVTQGKAILYTGAIPNKSDTAIPTGAAYAVLQGVGPVPGGAGTVTFINLGGAKDKVTISLAANNDFSTDLSADLEPIGKGITLENPGANCADCRQPHQFPVTATGGATVSFSCDPTVGSTTATCGEDDSTDLLRGLVITGSTTDAPINGKAPYEMPAPVTKYATFTCTFVGALTGQVPNDAIAAILATNPTRIETRVFRFSFAQKDDATTMNHLNFVAGHGLVGHTDVK